MAMRKKMTVRGLILLIPFFLLLFVIFSPVFPGKMNGLDYMDNLFNMISKGSSYFIPVYLEKSAAYAGEDISVSLPLVSEQQARAVAELIERSGGKATVDGNGVALTGGMDQLLKSCLTDADFMFNNNGDELQRKYGYSGQEVIYNWWTALKGIVKDLNKQKKFEEAKVFNAIVQKALEPAYNYYGVGTSSYRDNFLLISGSLLFYIIYTVWYGFGIMFLFEGLGLKVGH